MRENNVSGILFSPNGAWSACTLLSVCNRSKMACSDDFELEIVISALVLLTGQQDKVLKFWILKARVVRVAVFA